MSESVADEEEDDIYKNLPDFRYDDARIKLESANKELENRIRHLEKQYHETAEENLKLKEENQILHENISSLLKTANIELKRKDRVIEELRRENNQLIFRRKKTSHKTKIERHEHTDDNVQQEEELVHSCSNVQRHGRGSRLTSSTSNIVTDVEDVYSVLNTDNIPPITLTCTTKASTQYSNEVNDVGRLETNPSASTEFSPGDSIQDNYTASKVQKNVVETVFSARMRKRLNASAEKNKKDSFVSNNTKELCHDENINSNKGQKQPDGVKTGHNSQELEALETMKESTKSEEKTVNSGNILIELESDSSESVELDSMGENQDHRSSTEVRSNVVETVFSERMRNQLNISTKINDIEILVCTDTKQSRDPKFDDAKINNSKEERETNDETARLYNQELMAIENVEEATQNEEKSVNAGNILGELESDYSRSAELCSVDENADHNSTTEVQDDTVETVFSKRMRNQLNTSTKIDGIEILVCTDTKQSCDSKFEDAKINSSKEERDTNYETAGHNNQELKATEIMKEATQNAIKTINAGKILGELHTALAKQDCCSTMDIQKNVVKNVSSEQMRNQLNASTEENDKGILVCTGTNHSCESKINEVPVNNSKEEREINDETVRHNNEELKAPEILKEATQNHEKSVNAVSIIGELESNSSGSTEFHAVDAKEDCHSAMDIQENVVETIFSERMIKQPNDCTENCEKEILVCPGTKQSGISRIDVTKINTSKVKAHTNETARHDTCQEFEATEIEKEATQKERKYVNTGKISGELVSNSSGSIEVSILGAKQDSHGTTKGQKNLAKTVFSAEIRKQLKASMEIEHKKILICTGSKKSSDSGSCSAKINCSKEERGKNNDTPQHNTHKIVEDIETLKDVPLNEKTFVNADNLLGELNPNSCQSVEFESVGAKQDYHYTTKGHNNGFERKQLNDFKEIDDSETLAYTHTKQPDVSISHDYNISEGDRHTNDATVEQKTVQKCESTIDVEEVRLSEIKFADTVNIVGEGPLTNLDNNDSNKNSTPEHVKSRTSLNEHLSYGVDSKKHHSNVLHTKPHSPAFQKCHKSSTQSSSSKSSSIESCVIPSEERQNVQKSLQKENRKYANQDVKTNYHTGKQTEFIRPVKASASVRVANSVKSKYSRSRSKTPFDGSRFKIPKLSSKHRVQIERTSVLEQNDSDSDSARTRYSRQSSLHNNYRAYTSYRSRSHVRQSFRDSQRYTEHRKYKHRDSPPVRECSSSRYKHERRHSSAKFRDKDKRHIATRHSNVSKKPDPTRMESNGLLNKDVYCADAEKVIHGQKKPQNVDRFLEDEKHSKRSQKLSQHQNVMVENYNERKTKRAKSFSLKEITEKENLNISKGYEYKLKKITFEDKECRKPVSDLYRRLLSNSGSKLDKIQDIPEQYQSMTNEPNPVCSLGSAVLATEEQRKENIVSSSDAKNVRGQTANDTEGKQKKFCNSAVFKTDGVSVSIFRETCDFSTSRKRKSVVVRSQRTSGSHELHSPEEKRQRLSNDDKIIVETTNASVTIEHDDKRRQSVVKEGLHHSTEDCSDHYEFKLKKVNVEQSEKREVTSKRKGIGDTRIEDMSQELEEGEILDDSPVKTSTAAARFSELEHNVTLEHSRHSIVSKEISQRINPTSYSKNLLKFSDTLGQIKSSQNNRHSASSPTLGDHLLHKEQQHETCERQKMDNEGSNKYKLLDKFQNVDSEQSNVIGKPSPLQVKPSTQTSVAMNEKTQGLEPVINSAKFQNESCDSNDKDSMENGNYVSCQMNDTVSSSVLSESTCLLSNDSQYIKTNKQCNKQINGNEVKCKGEVKASSESKTLEDDFSLCGNDVIVSEDVNFSLNIETVITSEGTCKQMHDRKSDKLKKIVKRKLAEICIHGLSCGDTVDKTVDVSNKQIQESDNSLISDIGVQKETQPKSCQEPSSEHDKKSSKVYIEQRSKDSSVKSAVTSLNSKLVSPQRRKKNARMTISTSQSSLQSEILMANLLQTHSSYKVGIHDDTLFPSSKYMEEIANGASYNSNGSLICSTSIGSINTQSDDKHYSNSQRITRSKTTRLSSPSCQPDERICNSEESLKSPKEKMQKLMNFENEQINFQEKSCKMTSQHCQSEVQDNDSVCSYFPVQVDDKLNKHLEYETTCLHSCRELKSGSYQLITDDRTDEVVLQEISEVTVNESRETLGKDSMKITGDGCIEVSGGKEPLSGEELLKILEGSFENESGGGENLAQESNKNESDGSEHLAKESNSLQSENAVMPSRQQLETSTTADLPSATNKKNIIIRRRSRKCVLEEAPTEFITIKPLDDTNPDNIIDSSIAVSTDKPSNNNNSPVCVTPSLPLCLQHDDSSCSSSSSSSSSRSSSSSSSSCSSNCSNSSNSMSVKSSVSGCSKSSASGQQEESDKSNNTNMLRKSLRATPARRLYQKKSQMPVHQPPNEFQDSQELDMSNSSSSGNTSDDTFNPKKCHAKQLNATWVKRKTPRNKR